MSARAGSAPIRLGVSVGVLLVLTALVLTFFAWSNRAIDDRVVEPRPPVAVEPRPPVAVEPRPPVAVEPRPPVAAEPPPVVRPGAVEFERWTIEELLEARAIADAQRRELAEDASP